jgi:hypothetical protein
MKKNSFELMLDFLKTPSKVKSKTQEDNLKVVDKVLKPKTAKVVKFK